MPSYSIHTIAEWVMGKISPADISYTVDHLLLDSRKLVFPESSLFFALKTNRRNGHHYIHELYARQVRCFVVSEEVNESDYPAAVFIYVEDTLRALQQLVAQHRRNFDLPVIGITGSNGKTIIKEWLNFLVEKEYRIIRSPKSYNSQIGVPLSVWPIDKYDQLGIFEAGISAPGEMGYLENIIQPTIGLITNLGEAHDEGFENKLQKLDEKLNLFLHSNIIVYCLDHALIHENIRQKFATGEKKFFCWSEKHEADLKILSVQQAESKTSIRLAYKDADFSVIIPFSDRASIENAIHCIAVLLLLGYDNTVITERIGSLPALAMRLEMKQAINRCLLINDSYSADWNSFTIALDFLSQQQQHEKKAVIISDFAQSGKQGDELYESIAQALKQKKISRLIGIGPVISSYAHLFSIAETAFYPATAAFLEQFHSSQFKDESILLKGARSFAFERISQLLEQKKHQTVLEINLSSVTHNLKHYQSFLDQHTKLMVMVKAFSYGAGSYEMANLLQFNGIDYLAVAYADEGADLRKAGISLPVMVMNTDENSYPSLTQYDLQPEVFSLEMMYSLDSWLRAEGVTDFPVHIKLDTGMHRLGFSTDDIEALCEFLSGTKSFRVQTVFSHLAAGEDPAEDEYTNRQSTLFIQCCERLQAHLGYTFIRHIANTAAIRRHPHLQLDMVRLGIGLYGVDPAGLETNALKEVSTLKTTVAQVKMVRAGETVGYNRWGKVSRDSLIATIRIGYADGYPRSLGNGTGCVWINGSLYPVIGSVCMDMTMVDITGSPGIEAGTDVIVFGGPLPVSTVAKWAGTIPYEIMTGISQRVRRLYYQE
jgi:alanine racemase